MNSLRWRIFAMVFLVVAVAIGTVLVGASRGNTVAVESFVGASTVRDQHIAVEMLAGGAGPDNLPTLRARLRELGQAMGVDVLVINPGGQVLLDSSNTLVGQSIPVPAQWPQADVRAPLFISNQPAFIVMNYASAPGAGIMITGSTEAAGDNLVYFGPEGASGVSYTAGAAYGGANGAPEQFTTRVGPPPGSLAQGLAQNFNQTMLLAAAAAGGVALLLTVVLSRGIVGPVAALTLAAGRMARGELDQRVEISSRDEIGQLGRAFNHMADSLHTSEQLRRQMVTDIAHELRTPLTNIRGYLEAVRDGVLPAQPEVVDSLYEESMLLSRLVDDLQALALAEAGQLRLQLQACQPAAIIERSVAGLGPRTADEPPVRVELPSDLPPVQADPERVSQVLRNLLRNARQHTPPEGTVTITACALPGWVEITVHDTGSGIEPEHLPFVFERFYRADPARARSTGGAGLGLAIVKQLVEAHGGQVTVDSRPGAGAAFHFTLPQVVRAEK
ncbi:MAG: ATP-binding protein [Anaerolineales bacterium]